MIPSFLNLVHLDGRIRGDTQPNFKDTPTHTHGHADTVTNTAYRNLLLAQKARARWITNAYKSNRMILMRDLY